jgi:hypothetical protein
LRGNGYGYIIAAYAAIGVGGAAGGSLLGGAVAEAPGILGYGVVINAANTGCQRGIYRRAAGKTGAADINNRYGYIY